MTDKPTPYQMDHPQASTEIVLCGWCAGLGVIPQSELHDYHRSTYLNWSDRCSCCRGTGRLNKRVLVEYSTFDQPQPVPKEAGSLD